MEISVSYFSGNITSLVTVLFLSLLLQNETAADKPCEIKPDDLSSVCPPCDRDKWLEMLSPTEEITNSEQTCFNNDPISKYYGSNDPIGDGSSVLGTGQYRTTLNHGPRGFLLRKEPLFRYAYKEPPSPSSSPGPPTGDDKYWDLNDVKKYYVRDDSAGQQMDADFQMLEWPGATAEKVHNQINKEAIEKSGCMTYEKSLSCKNRKWMLQFERDNGKILHYPCNPEDGTDIVVVAALLKVNQSEPDESESFKAKESTQKIWLAHGNASVFNRYIQPLYVPQYVLEKLAKDEGPNCTKDEYLWDLRTVKDFVFTRNRLILGMKCGIILIGGLASNNLTFKAASLWSETGLGTNLFPEEINKVSSSTCCLSPVLCERNGGIVVAYSFKQNRSADENKYMYVSFDYGDTFETKIIASEQSPINLIKGMYKLYSQWHDYYEILYNPDEEDFQDDESEDSGLLKILRSKADWHSSTSEDREKLFSVGTATGKKNATLKRIVSILENRVPKRRNRRMKRKGGTEPDIAPEWVNAILKKIHKQFEWDESWDEDNCDDKKKCENDIAVEWLLGKEYGGVQIKTPTRREHEPFCKEITSILILAEERHIMALCQVGFGEVGGAPPAAPSSSDSDSGDFALYNFPIKRNLPMIYGQRVSQRIFKCKYIKNTLDPENEFIVQPEVVRLQGTATIIVINCDGVIYISTNFGSTLFNTAFYYEQETMDNSCSNHAAEAANDECDDKKNKTNLALHYLRSFRLCALDVPPVFATDVSGYRLLITFGKFYALGAIAYNRETRLVVGEILPELKPELKFANLLFPAIDRNGDLVLTILLSQAYSIPDGAFSELYKKKHGIRLVQMPLPYNRDVRNYDNGNLAMCKLAKEKKFGFPVCKTSSYTIYPKRLDMDVEDIQYVQVEVLDEDPFLPLWIFSSNEQSVEVKAFHSLRAGSAIPNFNVHNWKVEIIAKPNRKSHGEGEAFVDAFFASDYNRLNDYSTQISFVNRNNARCHVRPSSTVNVQVGCRGKRLIAHEDKYRPQCKYFRNNFNYTIKRGMYDPEMVNHWVATSSNQSRSFYKINSEGNLVVTYDYVNWGCPLEPFISDHFIPDLRVVDENTENGIPLVKPFEGKFILIEVLGAKGINYSKRVRDMDCTRRPQNLAEQIRLWKQRQHLFFIASERQKFPKTKEQLEQKDFTIKGNKILKNDAVMRHINIWNRANYLSCHEGEPENIPESMLDQEYEILNTREHDVMNSHSDQKEESDHVEFESEEEEKEQSESGHDESLNEIMWSKDHPRVYLFLAVAVDEYGSLCDYQTLFGVSLQTNPEMDDLSSFLIFLFFVLFWLLLVLGGYHWRKRYLRVSQMNQAKNEKLEQAAWSIIYRYEKLIHGNAMDSLFNTAPEAEGYGNTNMNLAARSVHDKRRAELRMKKTHIMAHEQARHERLQKLFQKQ